MKKRLLRISFLLNIVGLLFLALNTSLSDVKQKSYGFNPIHGDWGQAESSSWLSGWLYRKAHSITGSTAGEQANYPVLINVHYDNGFDFEGEVYIAGKCRTDFGDIRFTDSTGNNLDYWIQQKENGVHALFWVEINYIPQSPNQATIYVYYGNSNVTTASNKDWTFSFTTDFEDETTQGWTISWITHIVWDGVSTSAFEGNYSRGAGRMYGSAYAGNGDFYEHFRTAVYLVSGSYRIEGAARFGAHTSNRIPQEITFLANEVKADNMSNPSILWHWLSGNFTITTSGLVELDIEFHLRVQDLYNGGASFYVDDIFVRKWCDPEPTHGTWGSEEVLTRDVAVINVMPFKTVVGESCPLNINVTVENQGGSLEAFNFTVFFNETAIALPNGKNYTTISLASGGSATITFTWNTTGVAKSFYIISGYTWPLPLETDIADNTFADGLILVTIAGDINGDGMVDVFDLSTVGLSYGQFTGMPGYNPYADITADGVVDARDLAIVTFNYGNVMFSDDFNDGLTDSTKWTVFEKNNGTVSETNGRLEIKVLDPPGTAGYITKYTCSLSDVDITVDVSNGHLCETSLAITLDGVYDHFWYNDNFYVIEKHRAPYVGQGLFEGNYTFIKRRVDGGERALIFNTTWTGPVGSLRIRVQDGVIYLYEEDYLLYSEPYALSSYEAYIHIEANTWGPPEPGFYGVDYFDNFSLTVNPP